jgi:heptosyltransferase-2
VQPLPGIGDMVWHLPHIHAIAATTTAGKVDILTKPRSQADRLLGADPCVGQVLWLERESGRSCRLARVAATGGRTAARRLPAGVDSARQRPLRAGGAVGRHPRAVGVRRRLAVALLTVPVRLPPERRHAHPILRADALLDGLGISRDEKEPRLAFPAEAERAVAARFAAWPAPWIALGVGSSEPWKQWGAAPLRGIGAGAEPPRARFDFHRRRTGGTAAGGRDFSAVHAGGGVAVDAVALPLDQVGALCWPVAAAISATIRAC